MVRETRLRVKKWDKKIDPLVVFQRFSSLKEISKEMLDPYFTQVVAIEKRVKEFLEKEGVTPTQIAFYLAYARELLGKTFGSISSETLRNEELALRTKWVQRGLEDSKLQEIAKMFGIDPKPLVVPPAPIPLDILNDFETQEDMNKITFILPEDINIERVSEWSYNGNYSIKFTGRDDWRYPPYPKFRINVDLSKYKHIRLVLYSAGACNIQLLMRGFDLNDNLVFEIGKDTGIQEAVYTVDGVVVNVGYTNVGVENWDLAKKIEIEFCGGVSIPIYLDTIYGVKK